MECYKPHNSIVIWAPLPTVTVTQTQQFGMKAAKAAECSSVLQYCANGDAGTT